MEELKAGDKVRMNVAPGWSGEVVEILDHDDQVTFRNDADGKTYQFAAFMLEPA